MKKIMILGAGSGQIPFINICKKKGAYVIVVSPSGEYPGIELADKYYDCDTRDKEAILDIAMNEGIDAITTDQTDVSVPSVAYVAEKMELKGIGYDCAMRFTDKYVMRCAAEKIGIPVPHFRLAHNLPEAIDKISELNMPVIIKPTNSSGSRGIHRIDSSEELENYFCDSQSYSSTKTVIIEEFINGVEYLADGFCMDRKYINLDVGEKEYFDKSGTYISKMCMFTSAGLADTKIEKMVLETNRKLVEGFGLEFGITHAEYMYCPKEDKVYLIEIAARGGGVYLSSDLTPTASGVHTNELLLDYLLDGKKTDVDKLVLQKKVAAWRCFALNEGVISSVKNVDLLKTMEGVDRVCLESMTVGTKVEDLKNDTTKYGPILVSGNSKEECYKTIDEVVDTLKIETTKNGKISQIIW